MVIYIDDNGMIAGRRKSWYLSLSLKDGVLTIRTPPPETGERLIRNPLLVLGSYHVNILRMLFTDSARSFKPSAGYNAITREIYPTLPFSGEIRRQRFTIAYENDTLCSFIVNLNLEYRHKGGITRIMNASLVVDTQETIEVIKKLLTKSQ